MDSFEPLKGFHVVATHAVNAEEIGLCDVKRVNERLADELLAEKLEILNDFYLLVVEAEVE